MKFSRFTLALLLTLSASLVQAKINLKVMLNDQMMEGNIDLNQVVIVFGENDEKGEPISRMYYGALSQDEQKVSGLFAIMVKNEEGKMAPICDDIPVDLFWNERKDIKFTENFTMGFMACPVAEDTK